MLILNDEIKKDFLATCRDHLERSGADCEIDYHLERIGDKFDVSLQAQVNHLASMSEKKSREEVSDIISKYEGYSITDHIHTTDAIMALLVAQKEEARQAVTEEITGWLKEYAVHGGDIPLKEVLEDMKAHSPFMSTKLGEVKK